MNLIVLFGNHPSTMQLLVHDTDRIYTLLLDGDSNSSTDLRLDVQDVTTFFLKSGFSIGLLQPNWVVPPKLS